MPRPLAFLAAALLALTAGSSLVAWKEHEQLASQAPEVRKSAIIESENDALRDALAEARREASDAQNALRRSQIERTVTSIRELPFNTPVVYDVLDRDTIRQVVARKLSEQYTDQELTNMATGLSAFGLLPPNFPLKQTYIDLLGEQIGAFYDQHQHKLFMFRDASLENAQNRVILAHELTHALQDQNFGLLKLPLEIKNNDDQAEAASALVEGDATLVMTQYMAQDLTWRTLADTVTYSVTQRMEQIRKAPHYLREMLVFPYLKGQLFCSAVYARGGFAALSEVYAHPPASTAQILHPEKYFAETREDPIPVTFKDTTVNGQNPLADNVLGEMGMRLLFAQSMDEDTAESVSDGWRGDRYLVYDNGDTLVWKTVWNSPAAAASAISAMKQMCASRFHLTFPAAGNDLSSAGDSTHFARIVVTGANEVVFMLATNKESCDLLHQQFAGASHG
jgi:hypothetical protein